MHLEKVKRKNIRQFTTILQQMKEPYVTTYAKKYKVMRGRHLKLSVFFYAVKQQIISFLLDYFKTYSSMVCQGLVA